MKKVTRAALSLCAAGTMLVAGTAAEGHIYTASTTTTIRYVEQDGQFTGRIDSDRRGCKRGRVVKLKKITADGSQVVGEDISGRRGRWKIREANAAGNYRAIVRRRVTDEGPDPVHSHDCLRGSSTTINVDP